MNKKNKKMSIFLSNPCSIYKETLTTDSSWYRFVSKLGRNGDYLTIVAPDLEPNASTFSIQLNTGVTFHRLEHFYYRSFKQFYRQVFLNPFYFFKQYFQIIKVSDLVIFRIPTPGFSLVAVLAILLKKPFIVFVSGNIRDQSDTFSNSQGPRRLFFGLVLRVRIKLHSQFLKKCKYVFCVSKDSLKLYNMDLGLNVEIARTPVISSRDISLPRRQSRSSRVFRIVRACWLQESKGLENLIFAINKVSKKYDVSLDIFGTAKDNAYGQSIAHLIYELKLSDIVNLRGWLSNEELQTLYGNFDLHVMSSLSEGMPRVCLESAAKGLPQLVTPVGGVPDFFTHLYDAFICKDYSAASIAEGLEWFLENKELSYIVAQNAQNGARDSTIENFSERFNRIIYGLEDE